MREDIPGRELGKEFAGVVKTLVLTHGWRYDNGSRRGGHPMLYPADRSQAPLAVPKTPSDRKRAFKNFLADVRRRGASL